MTNSYELLLYLDASEPSFIQRVIGLFNSSVKLPGEAVMPQPSNTTKTTDIEMTTFSMVSSQSPGVTPAMCCSMAGCNSNMAGPMGTICWISFHIRTKGVPIH